VSAKFEYLYLTAASLAVSHHSEIRLDVDDRFGGSALKLGAVPG